jgi:aminotransferase
VRLFFGSCFTLILAAVVGLGFPDAYYDDLVAGYRARRDLLVPALRAAGFRIHEPAGAYYVMTDIADLAADGEDDVAFALRLIRDPGVAAVPGSSFFSRPELGRSKLRFAFPKRTETLLAATERLSRLAVRA